MKGLSFLKNMCKSEKLLRILASTAYLLIKNIILTVLIKITETSLEIKQIAILVMLFELCCIYFPEISVDPRINMKNVREKRNS